MDLENNNTPGNGPNEIRSIVFPSGLKAHFYETIKNSENENVELRLRIKIGSSQEDNTQKGYAHFVEHMAFNGTSSFPKQKIVEFLSESGMKFGTDINAHTSFDETVYKLSIPASRPDLVDVGIKILREFSDSITFDPEEVEKEKGVILEEWRSRYGSELPAWTDEFYDLYRDTPFAERLPIGDMKLVESATADELREFYSSWYSPQNAEIIIVYPELSFNIISKIKNYFNSWESQDSETTLSNRIELPKLGSNSLITVSDSYLTYSTLKIYYPIPFSEYFNNETSELEKQYFQDLVSESLTHRLRLYAEENDSSIFDISAGVTKLVNSQNALLVTARVNSKDSRNITTSIDFLIRDFIDEGITSKQFRESNSRVLKIFEVNKRKLLGASNKVFASYLLGALKSDKTQYISLNEKDRQLEKFSSLYDHQMFNKLMEDNLKINAFRAYSYEPRKVTHSDLGDSRDPRENVIVQNRTTPLMTNEECIANYKPADSFKPQSIGSAIKFSNGVTIRAINTKHEVNRIRILAINDSGLNNLPNELIPASSIWSKVKANVGFNEDYGEKFRQWLTNEGVVFTVFLEKTYSGVYIESDSNDLNAALNLIDNVYFTNISQRDLISKTIEDTVLISEGKKRKYNHGYQTSLNAILFGNDVRARIPDHSELKKVDSNNLNLVSNMLSQGNSGLSINIVGDFQSLDLIGSLAETTCRVSYESNSDEFGNVKKIDANQTIRFSNVPESRTDIEYYFGPSLLSLTPENYIYSEVFIQVLKNRFRKELREEESLTYGVSVSHSPPLTDFDSWIYRISFSTNPNREGEAIAKLDSILNEIKLRGIKKQEVNQAVFQWATSIQNRNNSNSFILDRLKEAYFLNSDNWLKFNLNIKGLAVDSNEFSEFVHIVLNANSVIGIQAPDRDEVKQ